MLFCFFTYTSAARAKKNVSVPQGGYVTSCILRVASIHFRTTLARCNQPHTIALHLSFLRRSAVGRATFTVSAAKIGRTFSVVQISVAQSPGHERGRGRSQSKSRIGSVASAATATDPAAAAAAEAVAAAKAAAPPDPFVVGYLTQANLAFESGVSLPTHFRLEPAPLPRGSTADLRANADPNWVVQPQPPFSVREWRNALRRVETYIPRRGGGGRRVSGDSGGGGSEGGGGATNAANDEWIRLASGERWTQESLGFVCDTFPLIPDAYGLQEDAEQLRKISDDDNHRHLHNDHDDDDQRRRTQSSSDSTPSPFPSPSVSASIPQLQPPALPPTPTSPSKKPTPTSNLDLSKFWFPTLVLNIEFKKLLPPEGVEWLFVRVRPKQIRNGRMDLEVVVLDEEGDIVALSWHVALIVGGERNSRGRL